MAEQGKFLDRFKRQAEIFSIELRGMKIHPLEIEWDRTLFKEEMRNAELKTVRLISIKYVDEEIKSYLNGNGEAFMGGSDRHKEPDLFEKLDINIPSDATDIKQVWRLYEEWLIKWTPANELRQLVGEPIREGEAEKGSE